MRCMADDLRRAIVSRNFLLVVFLIFLMYFFDGFESLGANTSLAMHLDDIMGIGAFTWLVPCVGAICYAGSYVSERKSGYARYACQRGGVFRYVTSKAVATYFSALLATYAGITLYAIYAYAINPVLADEHVVSTYREWADSLSFCTLARANNILAYIALHILCRSLAAGMWAVVGLSISFLWPNQYAAIFSPALITYFKDFVYAWISINPSGFLKRLERGDISMTGVIAPISYITGIFLGISVALCLGAILSLQRRLKDV